MSLLRFTDISLSGKSTGWGSLMSFRRVKTTNEVGRHFSALLFSGTSGTSSRGFVSGMTGISLQVVLIDSFGIVSTFRISFLRVLNTNDESFFFAISLTSGCRTSLCFDSFTSEFSLSKFGVLNFFCVALVVFFDSIFAAIVFLGTYLSSMKQHDRRSNDEDFVHMISQFFFKNQPFKIAELKGTRG
jgi:hypothetical protein